MKKTILFLTVLACMSCSKEETTRTEDKINLITDITPLTRINMDETGKGNFTHGDVISLFISDNDSYLSAREFKTGQTELFWHELNLPLESKEVLFAGCYPVLSHVNGAYGVFDVSSTEEKDLLLAPAVSVRNGSTTPINISFRHALHRLKIVYISTGDYTEEELQSISTLCTAKSACEINIATGSVTRTLEQTATFSASSSEAIFILPPQESEGVTLSVSFFGNSKEFNLSEWLQEADLPQENLLGGKELQLTITVNKDGISFGNMSIEGWDNQGTAEGDIIL